MKATKGMLLKDGLAEGNHEEDQNMERLGWRVAQSIPMELDAALTTIYGYFGVSSLAEDVAEMVQACPEDWVEEGLKYLGSGKRIVSLMEMIAQLAGVLLESDYRTATLAMRALSLDDAVVELQRQSEQVGLSAHGNTPKEQFVNLAAGLKIESYRSVGFELTQGSPQDLIARAEADRISVILRDGALHDSFWFWMDRFYYDLYRDWRAKKAPELQALQNQTTAMLAARSPQQASPQLDWLSAMNPLHSYPELKTAVTSGNLEAVFWVEPFGLFDTWTLYPGRVVVSFSEPGILYENFKSFVEDVAVRTKALADPTRLMILRMIRQFDLMNTEMADLLGVSRPTVSVHARILREAGLIRSFEDGRAVRHQIVPEAVHQLFDDLKKLLDLPEIMDDGHVLI